MRYTIYVTATGQIIGHLDCHKDQLEANLRDGEAAYEGTLEPAQRMNHASGQPVAPSREQLAEAAQGERKLAIRARIDMLERAQHRRVRELLAGQDQRLKALDDEITELRAELVRPAQ